MAFYRCGSGGSTAPDFNYTGYKKGGSFTFTFDQDFSKVYIGTTSNTASDYGTYTGNGTKTNLYNYAAANDAYGFRYGVGVLLENVKSGDVYKVPVFTISGSTITFLTILGWH